MRSRSIGILAALFFSFFAGEHVLSANPAHCFYFKNGAPSAQCNLFDIEMSQPFPDFKDSCKNYAVDLKKGEAYPENLYGVYTLGGASTDCPALPSTKQDKITTFKFSGSTATINSQQVLINNGKDGLLFIATILAKTNGFLDEVKLLGIQDGVDQEAEKDKFANLLVDHFATQSANFCCITELGFGTGINYACSAPTKLLMSASEITDEFIGGLKEEFKASFNADDAFEFFIKDLNKDKLHDLYACDGVNSGKQSLFDYSCGSTSGFITTPGTQSKNGTPSEICAFNKVKIDTTPATATPKFEIPSTEALNQLGTLDPKILLARGIQTILGILGSISLVMFVYGGILYMTDLGNSERAEKAKQIFIWNSLGLMVIFASYAIIKMIFEAFN